MFATKIVKKAVRYANRWLIIPFFVQPSTSVCDAFVNKILLEMFRSLMVVG